MTDANPFYFLQSIARQIYHGDKKDGKRNDGALLVMGLTSIAIGAILSEQAIRGLWKDYKKGRHR